MNHRFVVVLCAAILFGFSDAFTNLSINKGNRETKIKTCLGMIDKKVVVASVATACILAGIVSADVAIAQVPSSQTVAGIEIVPAGGGGFGGMGISPFGAGPFGGFGKYVSSVSRHLILPWSSADICTCTYSRQDLASASVQRLKKEFVYASRMTLKYRGTNKSSWSEQ